MLEVMYIQQTGPIVTPGRFGSGQPYPWNLIHSRLFWIK